MKTNDPRLNLAVAFGLWIIAGFEIQYYHDILNHPYMITLIFTLFGIGGVQFGIGVSKALNPNTPYRRLFRDKGKSETWYKTLRTKFHDCEYEVVEEYNRNLKGSMWIIKCKCCGKHGKAYFDVNGKCFSVK